MQQAPAHAIQVWIEGDDIKLCFLDQGQTHVTTLDGTKTGIPTEYDAQEIAQKIKLDDRSPSKSPLYAVRGWAALKRVLRDRAEAVTTPKIGQSSAPTQHQLDQLIKAFGGTVKIVGAKRVDPDVSLEDLGL